MVADGMRRADVAGRIAIAAPGYSGAALLVQLLTEIGLDTGFDRDDAVDARLRAGGGLRVESPRAPRIVIDLDLSRRLGTLLAARAVEIEHVIVPVRALDVAAASRVRAGGFVTPVTTARNELATDFYELVEAITRFELPHTLLAFPRFAMDWEYLFRSLGFLDPTIPAEHWREAVERWVELDRIHERRLDARERMKTIAGSLLETTVSTPARGAHRFAGDLGIAARYRLDGAPAEATIGSNGARADGSDVVVHVASINTAAATELCVRSMREYAGRAFDLVVGDCGSTDGSLPMLRGFEARGWLRLEVAPDGRMHAEWLDRWLRSCTARFAVFVDSDIEFLEPGWLDDMVQAGLDNDAALVCAQMLGPRARYVHPQTGAKRTLGPRPAPWLVLLDTEMLHGRVDASFAYRDVVDAEAFGGKIGYDVGGAYFAALRDAGLGWLEMPSTFRRKFHHFSGLSWRRLLDLKAPMRMRPGQARRIATVYLHLWRARALGFGAAPPSAAKHEPALGDQRAQPEAVRS